MRRQVMLLCLVQNMSRVYRCTASVVLFMWLAIGCCLLFGVYRQEWSVWLLFFMPVLWTTWLIAVLFDIHKSVGYLVLLWVLIDISVLAVLSQLVAGTGSKGNGGEDYVLAVAFSPLVLPEILAAALNPVLGTAFSAISRGATSFLPTGVANFVRDWLGFSVLSAISSCIFGFLCQLLGTKGKG